jgi:hypothetical protein
MIMTDIKQTRVYQEAKQEGETQLLLRQLSKRFGMMGNRRIQAINQLSLEQLEDLGGNRSGGNQENELHGIGWNHYEQAVVIDFIANNSE